MVPIWIEIQRPVVEIQKIGKATCKGEDRAVAGWVYMCTGSESVQSVQAGVGMRCSVWPRPPSWEEGHSIILTQSPLSHTSTLKQEETVYLKGRKEWRWVSEVEASLWRNSVKDGVVRRAWSEFNIKQSNILPFNEQLPPPLDLGTSLSAAPLHCWSCQIDWQTFGEPLRRENWNLLSLAGSIVGEDR